MYYQTDEKGSFEPVTTYLSEAFLLPLHFRGDILGDGELALQVGRPVHAVLDQRRDGCN
jgi:hypothetical protein